MKISRINTNVINSGKLLAYVTFVIDDMVKVRGVRIIRSTQGTIIVAMPSRESGSGELKDVVFPVSQSARTIIETAILEKVLPLLNERPAAI